MTPIRSSLARAPALPTRPEELERLRERAWQEQGIAVLNPREIVDDWLRQAIKNFAAKRWGRRFKR